MTLCLKGVPIGFFDNLDAGDSRLRHRTDQAEIDACAHCEFKPCVCNYSPGPSKRRCALERYLDDRAKEKAGRSNGMLGVAEFARLVGVTQATINKRRWLGWYPGARKVGTRWAYLRTEAGNRSPQRSGNGSNEIA